MTYFLCVAAGAVLGIAFICFLLIRSHRNFAKMFHATPKDKKP